MKAHRLIDIVASLSVLVAHGQRAAITIALFIMEQSPGLDKLCSQTKRGEGTSFHQFPHQVVKKAAGSRNLIT